MLCTDCVLDSNIQGNNKRILPGPPKENPDYVFEAD